MKFKNIFFVLVKRTSADSHSLRGLLHSDDSLGFQKLLRLHNLQKHLRHCPLFDYIKTAKENGDKYSKRIAFELAVKGWVQEGFMNLYQSTVELFSGREVEYPD